MRLSFPRIFGDAQLVTRPHRRDRSYLDERYPPDVIEPWTPPDDLEQRLKRLGKRKMQICRMLCAGHSLRTITDEFRICQSTANNHRLHAYKILGVKNLAQLMIIALERGWIETKPMRLAREEEERRKAEEERLADELKTLRH